MGDKQLSFQEWLALGEEERKLIYDSWDRYRGDGEGIVAEACRLFKEVFKKHKDIVNISYGLYHGGDWIISITLRVGYDLKIPDEYLGFGVVKLYDGLAGRLRKKLSSEYSGDVERFIEGEMGEFRKCFNFTDARHAKEWLMDFVKKQETERDLA